MQKAENPRLLTWKQGNLYTKRRRSIRVKISTFALKMGFCVQNKGRKCEVRGDGNYAKSGKGEMAP